MKKIVYKDKKTAEISMPLGGIGTGCIGLLGNGRLSDFEIFGRPNKKCSAGNTFFAIKAESDKKLIDARVLMTDSVGTRSGFDEYKNINELRYNGYGYGPGINTFSGFPHFPNPNFTYSFPFAQIDFEYEKFPAVVKMTAFNPFIPMNVTDSSIPAAFFEFEIENTTDKTCDYTICGTMQSPLEKSVNSFSGDICTNMKCIDYTCADDSEDDGSIDCPYNAKSLCLATDCENVSYQRYLYRGKWYDTLQKFWSDFTSSTVFKDRAYNEIKDNSEALIAAHITLAPHEKKTVRFIITWYMRYLVNYWNPAVKTEDYSNKYYVKGNSWKNYYTRYFTSSHDCAAYCFTHWDRLKEETLSFTETLYTSTLPDEILDAIGGNLSILKSSTILRHSDGSVIGFEGAHVREGSCEGNCTHVYNYAYALAHLFPSFERNMRENEFNYSMNDIGAIRFRMLSPVGRKPDRYFACADGQFGGIIKVYREFKMTGDTEWLAKIWDKVKLSLDFTFNPDNPFKWDTEKTGILSGRQHNTLDTELYSPNSWLHGLYTAALKAASEMAEILKDKKKAAEYSDLYHKAKEYLNSKLYNGRYFCQKIDIKNRELLSAFSNDTSANPEDNPYYYYWDDESGEIKYQIGDGSSIDQTLAQWHADNVGLGEIFEENKLKSALKTIYDENFKKDMRDYFNPCRNFCINDESGVAICVYPEGAKKPAIPIPYAEECMNGFEYQIACQMLRHGMTDEGLEIVRAIRKRYDGEYRNPFSEMECGSSYIRSLASYALLGSVSGFTYDMYNHIIKFKPENRFFENGYYKCFYAVAESYGFVEAGPDYIQLNVISGEFKVRRFGLHKIPRMVTLGNKKIGFTAEGFDAVLENSMICSKEKPLMVIFD